MNDLTGRTLGRFRVVGFVGSGGMGSVWRAEHPGLALDVALKVLKPDRFESETDRRRFLSEARTTAGLEHPNIVQVYDAGETDGLAWIAYRWVDGESIQARLERGPLSLAEARSVALDVARALEHAHSRGVTHRDVTAGNVLVARDGTAKLVDFGLARTGAGDSLTRSQQYVGTPGYVAPEVLRGNTANAQSDLYGLGVLLFRMLTGRMPFEQAPARALSESPPSPSKLRPDLPARFEDIVLRLLAASPERRYRGVTELVRALEDLDLARRPSAWDGVRRRIAGLRPQRVVLAALLAVASLVVLFGVVPRVVTHEPPTVAVLPFRNETEDPDETHHVVDRFGEELAGNLAQTERLRVLPWLTTGRVRIDSVSVKALAHDLKAQLLLLGTVRSMPDGYRVSLSLVDGRTGVQRWGRSFEGVAGELPALNARILFETAAALLGRLTPEERSRMQLPSGRNGRAYEIYLEAAPFLVADDPQSLRMAELLFHRSLELDSTFADAHVGLGAVYNSRYFKGIEGGDQNLQLAREHFETAARLDSTSALAMRALTNLYWQDNDGEKCLAIAKRARSMRPRTLDLQVVAQEAYTLGGLSDIGADIGEEILAVDPANPAARFWQVISTAFSGQPHRVLFHGKEYIRRFGEDAETYSWMSDAAGQLGEKDKAVALARRATELEENSRDPRYLWNLSVTEEEFVGPARARETRMKLRDLLEQRLSESPNQTRNRFMLMQVLGRLNERDRAMQQWRHIKAALDSTGRTLTPDIPLAVPILVRMGEADEARRMKSWLEERRIYATDDFDSRMLLLESRDPLVLEYIDDARAEGARRRALYGRH